jgi:hypothetical protein
LTAATIRGARSRTAAAAFAPVAAAFVRFAAVFVTRSAAADEAVTTALAAFVGAALGEVVGAADGAFGATVCATVARAERTRATARRGEEAGSEVVCRTAVTAGAVVACSTAATGATTPASGAFACAGPADHSASMQTPATNAEMLPRQERAQFALVNICG